MQAEADVMEAIKMIRGDSSFLELMFQLIPGAASAVIEVTLEEFE